MSDIAASALLKDKEILSEINRYKWLQSEKEGADIGIERACREWLDKCSKQYFTQHPAKSAILWVKSQPLYGILSKEIL